MEKFKKILILLVLFSCCTNDIRSKNYLGKWRTKSYYNNSFTLDITKSSNYLIIEYSGLPNELSKRDFGSQGTLIANYDKLKDKLIIKADEDLDAIYDTNKKQLVIEKWGAFSKIN